MSYILGLMSPSRNAPGKGERFAATYGLINCLHLREVCTYAIRFQLCVTQYVYLALCRPLDITNRDRAPPGRLVEMDAPLEGILVTHIHTVRHFKKHNLPIGALIMCHYIPQSIGHIMYPIYITIIVTDQSLNVHVKLDRSDTFSFVINKYIALYLNAYTLGQ